MGQVSRFFSRTVFSSATSITSFIFLLARAGSDRVWSNAIIALNILLSYSVSMLFKSAETVSWSNLNWSAFSSPDKNSCKVIQGHWNITWRVANLLSLFRASILYDHKWPCNGSTSQNTCCTQFCNRRHVESWGEGVGVGGVTFWACHINGGAIF